MIEYSKNCRKTIGSLWNYYRDEPNSGFDGEGNNGINYSIKDSEPFNYKTSITGKLEGNNTEKDDVNCSAIKIFKQLLKNTRYAIDQL